MNNHPKTSFFEKWYYTFIARFQKPTELVVKKLNEFDSNIHKDFVLNSTSQSSNPALKEFKQPYNETNSQPEFRSSKLENDLEKSNTLNGANKKIMKYKEISSNISLKSRNRRSNNKSSRISTNRQQVVSITYEEIGLFPRSFNRVFDRFFKQLFFDVENLVVQEYRFYRYLFLTTVKCVFILICVPLTVNFCSKHYLIRPITEYYWNSQQPEIFLNSYMQKRAFNELKDFEEKMYFESLTHSPFWLCSNSPNELTCSSRESKFLYSDPNEFRIIHEEVKKTDSISNNLITNQFDPANHPSLEALQNSTISNHSEFAQNVSKQSKADYQNDVHLLHLNVINSSNHSNQEYDSAKSDISVFRKSFNEYIQQRLQIKTLELALHYNEESIEAITNFFADFMSFITLWSLLLNLEIQMNITKSFLLEVFFGLDDSKKSLFILFVTDLLVGYHSPNIWELFFSSLFDHYGLPENETTIFLLVATLPVLLDVLFKYLIFRHLNRASPATVATYHAMIE